MKYFWRDSFTKPIAIVINIKLLNIIITQKLHVPFDFYIKFIIC